MEILGSRLLLRPTDPERSRRFYRDQLGLAVYREFGSGAGRGTVFFLGGGFLELSGWGTAPTDGTQLWLQVRDLEEAHRRLVREGIPVEDPPAKKPWGLLEMRVRDPDGLLLIFVEVPAEHPLRRDARS